MAADALGPERVTCVSMPSPYSSEGTRTDARTIAENLGVDFREIGIEQAMHAYEEMLSEAFEGREPDVAEENVQARIRGNVVMALSNKFGWLVLATGNKSELSVGYATLYGDMAGGFAVLKDVYKGWVYRLVRWRNEQEGRELVPASVLDRPPSAELRHEQRDDDSLPPYDVLDRILEGYVEEDLDAVELVHRGLPAEDVERVIRMVDRAEYKRRQAPPGIKISTRAFGRDRRLPITNRYETSTRSRRAAAQGALAGRTASVTREAAQSRPSSSVKLHVPDPARAAAVDGRALGVHGALGDRAQEVRVVRLADGEVAVALDGQVRGGRDHRLRERGVGAAVHEPERLLDALLDREAARGSAPATASSSSKPSTSSRVPGAGYVPTGESIPAGTLQFAPNGHVRSAFARAAGDRRARAPAGEDLCRARGDARHARGARARAGARRARGARPGERARCRGGLARPARRLRARPAVRPRGHRHEGPPAPLRGRPQLGALAARLARAAVRERLRAGDPGGRARTREAARAAAAERGAGRSGRAERVRRPERGGLASDPVMRRRLLAGAAAAAVVLLVVLVWPVGLLTGDDDKTSSASSDNQASTQGGNQNQPAATNAPAGIAIVVDQGGKKQLLVQAARLAPSGQNEGY